MNKLEKLKSERESIIKEIKSKINDLESHLNNFRDNCAEQFKVMAPKTQEDKVYYYLYEIIKDMENELIISLMLGRLLVVISSFNTVDSKNDCVKVFDKLGNELINTYIYSLYKVEKANLSLSQ